MAPSCHSHTRLSTNHTYSAKSTKGPSGHDSTPYGDGRASPRSFFPHHLAAISSAIVRADALAIRNNAAAVSFSLSHSLIGSGF